MVNVRTSGFDSPAQLREHLAEIEDEKTSAGTADIEREASLDEIQREIGWMRRDLAALREQIAAIRQMRQPEPPRDDHPWMRIVLSVAATLLLGGLAQRLRLGAAGAAAVPMIVARATRANGREYRRP